MALQRQDIPGKWPSPSGWLKAQASVGVGILQFPKRRARRASHHPGQERPHLLRGPGKGPGLIGPWTAKAKPGQGLRAVLPDDKVLRVAGAELPL